MPDPDPTSVFDLDGGRPCLDFANTRSSNADHLTTYFDLLAFASQAHLLTPEAATWLHAAAEHAPAAAEDMLQRARTLRDAFRRLFLAIANGTAPAADDLRMLNQHLAESLVHARVQAEPTSDTYAWGWDSTELGSPLWPIVRSAADVLTSDQERQLVRECGASDCFWLFMDSSRNRSRQWCSMTSCGNREKARRHYQRLKARQTADAADPRAEDGQRGPRRGRQTEAAPSGGASATAE